MYESLWSKPETGFRSVLKTLLSNPAFVLQHIFVKKKFWYAMHLLVPLVFVPLRRWYLWATLIPGAILTLLVTDYDPPIMFSFQYVMHWIPYLFAATPIALAAITREEARGPARAAGATLAIAVVSLALSYNYGAFPLRDKALRSGYHQIRFGFSEEERKTLAEVRRLVAAIPVEASVAATERVGAHLSSRVLFYTLRRGSHGAEYVVANRKGLRLDRTAQSVKEVLTSGKYGLLGWYGEFALLRRGAPTTQNAEVLKAFGLDAIPAKERRRKQRGADPDQPEADVESESEDEPPSGGD
jgi:hypothetical protein